MELCILLLFTIVPCQIMQVGGSKSYKFKIELSGYYNSCSPDDLFEELQQEFKNFVLASFEFKTTEECGSGLWKEVMNLNMANHCHSCPSGWKVSSNPRACSRGSEFCASTRVPVNINYSRVCGRVLGSGKESTNGFRRIGSEGGYVDGVTITRNSASHEHVWTFASDRHQKCKCQTATKYTDIVGSNYFCDRNGNNLWSDSSGCQSSSSKCCGLSHPPWFNTSLSQRSDEDLLVSICCDQDFKNEDVLVKEVLLYVQ